MEEARAKGVEDDTADRRAKQEMNYLEFVQTTGVSLTVQTIDGVLLIVQRGRPTSILSFPTLQIIACLNVLFFFTQRKDFIRTVIISSSSGIYIYKEIYIRKKC